MCRSGSLPLRRSFGASGKRLQESFDGGSPRPASTRPPALQIGAPLSPRRQDSGLMEGSRYMRSSTVSRVVVVPFRDATTARSLCIHRLTHNRQQPASPVRRGWCHSAWTCLSQICIPNPDPKAPATSLLCSCSGCSQQRLNSVERDSSGSSSACEVRAHGWMQQAAPGSWLLQET